MTSYDKLLVAGRCLRLAMQLFFGLSSQNIGMSGCCPTIACVMHALKCGLYCYDLLCIYIYMHQQHHFESTNQCDAVRTPSLAGES